MKTVEVCLLWVLVASSHPSAGEAQTPPPKLVIEDSEVRELASKEVGVAFKLYVRLPASYAEGAKRYPVVYLLDADYSFLLARNITEHLSDRDDLEELILVGIAYAGPLRYRLNRTRDYTPSFVPTGGYGREYQKVSGGGPKFRSFIERELVPWIEKEYRALPGDRTLIGHSYGGLFGAYMMLTRPELFNRVILISPSLWYDDKLVFRLEDAYAKEHQRLPVKLYLAVGSREANLRHNMVADLQAFAKRLEARGYRDLRLRSQVWEDETHDTVFPLGLSTGLRFVHDGR